MRVWKRGTKVTNFIFFDILEGKKLYKKTSLGPHVQYFRKSFLQPKSRAVRQEQARAKQDKENQMGILDI